MAKIFAVSDVHGFYDELIEALNKAGFDENNENMIRYYMAVNNETEEEEMLLEKDVEGYTYYQLTPEQILAMGLADCTAYVATYVAENMITDTTSELYGCVKVNAQFAKVLELLMDKYTFEGVEYSWMKLCYYYSHLGASNN